MYLDIILIDYIDLNGVLTTYRVTPKMQNDKVVIDKLDDIDINYICSDSIDIGSARIYNSSNCSIQVQKSKIKKFSIDQASKSIFFSIEHKGIPVGSQRHGRGGYYNFILSPGFKFTNLHIVDPYDNSQREIERKKHFQFDVIWDTSCHTSLAKMFLTSSRGTFSFLLLGNAMLYEQANELAFLRASESQVAVSGILDYQFLCKNDRQALANDIAQKINWLELKPNFMGIGINLNAIIEDSINAFQRKISK